MLKLVNDKDNNLKEEVKKVEGTSALVEKQRSVDDIKRIVNNLMIQDKDLNAMFKDEEAARTNPLINSFREKQL